MLSPARPTRSAAILVLLVAVAFANALGSVVVFPLAPFIAADLALPAQQVALTTVFFNGTAAIGGLVGAFFLGRVDRGRALVVSLLGLGLATAGAGLAPNLPILLAARLLGGLCAGPLLALVVAMAADHAPPGMGARAISAIVGSYGMALLLGSPIALVIADLGGSWRGAFWAMAVLCLGLAVPFMRRSSFGEAADPAAARRLGSGMMAVVRRTGSLTGLLLVAGASFGTLLISPHLAVFALRNAGVNVAELGSIYLVGGGVALLSTGSTGWIMDRIGIVAASFGVGVSLTALLAGAFLVQLPAGLAMPVLGLVLAGQLARSTVAQGSASKIPLPADRTAYQCLVSAVTSLSQAAGAGVSTLLVSEGGDGRLVGMSRLALLSILICWLSLWLVMRLERRLGRPALIIDAPRT